MRAVTTPSFAMPVHVIRNSGRFSISSAATSPVARPASWPTWATRFAAALKPP